MRSPTEPVSTCTWSTDWHWLVPGTHTVTVAYKMLVLMVLEKPFVNFGSTETTILLNDWAKGRLTAALKP